MSGSERKSMRRTLLILTHNMVESSRALFPAIPWSEFDEALVLDSGSDDGTVKFYLDRGLEVLGRGCFGRGGAAAVGLSRTVGDLIVVYTPDGRDDPCDIMRLVREIEAGSDLSIASRFAVGARHEEDGLGWTLLAWSSRALSFAANFLFRRGPYISDTVSGFRAFRRSLYESALPDERGSAADYQVSIRAMKLRAAITEIPTVSGAAPRETPNLCRLRGWCGCAKVLLREIIGMVYLDRLRT